MTTSVRQARRVRLPWWGWCLVAVGVIILAVGASIQLLGTRGGAASQEAAKEVGPCATGAATRLGAGTHVLRSGGVDRSYLIALPEDYSGARAYPLVVNFHGHGGNKEKQEANTAMGRTGSARGYVVVTPDGLGTPANWNWRGSAGLADDFGFVHALLTELRHQLCIDPQRVYATGHSNGSAFAAMLTCRAPYEFVAVAMVSATTPALCPAGVTPAVLAIHGTADPGVPYNGGQNSLGRKTPLPAAPRIVEGYARRYHCGPAPSHDHPAPGVDRTSYAKCDHGADVVLDGVVGGTHPWPGGAAAAADPADSAAGRTFKATEAILDFFDAHRGNTQ